MTDEQCGECGGEMSEGHSIADGFVKSFRVPFTKFVIGIADGSPEFYCYDCCRDASMEQGQEIFDSGFRAGILQGESQ